MTVILLTVLIGFGVWIILAPYDAWCVLYRAWERVWGGR